MVDDIYDDLNCLILSFISISDQCIVVWTGVCLMCKSKWQLLLSQLLSTFYALVMMVTTLRRRAALMYPLLAMCSGSWHLLIRRNLRTWTILRMNVIDPHSMGAEKEQLKIVSAR